MPPLARLGGVVRGAKVLPVGVHLLVPPRVGVVAGPLLGRRGQGHRVLLQPALVGGGFVGGPAVGEGLGQSARCLLAAVNSLGPIEWQSSVDNLCREWVD